MSQLNFSTVLPSVPIDKFNAYAIIPAFDYLAPIWNGASNIVTQFNYTASKRFVLRETPLKPSPYPLPNYLPVIKFRKGIVATRYKLWQDVDEVLQEVPYYEGQILEKNFVIEIWSVNNQARVTNPLAFNLYLSIRAVPPDMSNPGDFADPASSTEVLQPQNALGALQPFAGVDFGTGVMWLDN